MAEHRKFNVGESNYAEKEIQPWDLWRTFAMNPWDADIQKRLIRSKTVEGMTPVEARILDYKKIQHIAEERIHQLETGISWEMELAKKLSKVIAVPDDNMVIFIEQIKQALL